MKMKSAVRRLPPAAKLILLVTCHLSLVTIMGCGMFGGKDGKGASGTAGAGAGSAGQAGQTIQTKTDVVESAVTGVAFDPSVAVGDTGAVRGVATASGVRGIDLGGAEQGVRGGVRGGVRASPRRQDEGEAPVTGARVRIDGTSFETVTNEKGEFKIPYIPAGNYTIVGEKQGESGEVYAFSQSTSVAAGGEVDLGPLSLAETGAISGIVKRTDATSHLGTDVFIPGTSFAAKTDDDGNFKIFYIPKGTYSLAAMFPAFETLRLKDIQVKSKETTKVTDATLKRAAADKAKAGMIFGRVTAAGGGAVRDAVVTTIPETQTARSDTAGNFAISNISPGVYLVKASRGGFSENSKFVDIQESLFGQIEIRLAPNAQVMTAGADAAEKAGAAPSVSVQAPLAATPGATVHLVASVTDPDSENIYLKWKANGGTLSSTFASEVDWTAPNSNGIFIIELTVTDGILSERATVAISVSAGGQTIAIDTTPPFPPRPDKLAVKANPPGAEDEIGGAAGCVEPGASVKFYADGLLTSALASTPANADGSFNTVKVGDNKGDANDLIYIVVIDAAGNLGIPYFILNDKTPPITTLVDAVCPAGTQICRVNKKTATFTFSGDEEGATFECSIDSGPFSPCISPHTYSDLKDGNHLFKVRAVDKAGNGDKTPELYTWSLDATAPAVGTVSPANVDTGTHVDGTFDISAGITESAGVTSCDVCAASDGTCDTEWAAGQLTGTAPSFTCKAEGKTCANGANLTLNVRATDTSGNVGTGAAVARTCDAAGPTAGNLALTPAAKVSPTHATSGFDMAATFADGVTSVSGCEVCKATDGTCDTEWVAATFSGGTCSASAQTCTDGQTLTLALRGKDPLGNLGQSAVLTRKCDTTAPVAAVVTPKNKSDGSFVDATFDVSTDFTEAGAGLSSCDYCKSTDGTCDTEWVAGTVVGNQCQANNLTCTNGQALTFNMRSTDAVGNQGTGSPVNRTCDTAAPTAGAVGLANGFTATHVDGNYDMSATFGDGTGSGVTGCDYCQATDGTCNTEWTTSIFSGGTCSQTAITCTNAQSLTLNMRAIDGVGNIGPSTAITRTCDTVAPVIGTVTTPAPGTGTYVPNSFRISAGWTDAVGLTTAGNCQYCKSIDGTCDTEWAAATISGANCDNAGIGITCTTSQTLTLNIRATDHFGVTGTGTAISRTCDPAQVGVIGTVTPSATPFGTFVDSPFTITASVAGTSGATTCEYTTNNGGVWSAGSLGGGNCTTSTATCTDGASITLNVHAKDAYDVVGLGTAVSRTCDTAAPTTSASGGAYTFGNWSQADVTATLTCADGTGSGCTSTAVAYCVDTVNSCTPAGAYASGKTVTFGASSSCDGDPDCACASGSTCTIYVRYRSTDNVGNIGTTVSQTVKIDKQVPTIGTVTPQNTSDGTYVDGTYDVVATISDPAAGSGIASCQYCRRTTPTCTAPDWTAATVNAGNCQILGLTCTNGTNQYLNIRATDNVGNIGPGSEVLRTCDTTAPSWGVFVVRDGLGGDRDYQTAAELKANWTGTPTTAGSALNKFDVAVGTAADNSTCSAINTETLRAYSGALANTATNINTTLSPVNWTYYYVNVKACDGVNNCSCLASDGFRKLDPVVSAITSSSGDLKVRSDGTIHLVYNDGTNSEVEYAYASSTTLAAAAWSNVVAATATGESGSLALDASAKAYVAHRTGASPYQNYATNANGSWSSKAVGCGWNTNAIALTSTGTPNIFGDDGNAKYCNCTGPCTDGANSVWAAATTIGTQSFQGYHYVVFDNSDKRHIVFKDTSLNDAYYSTDASGSWVATALEATDNAGAGLTIARDPTTPTDMHVAYFRDGGTSTTRWLRYIKKTAGTWGTPESVNSPSYSTAGVGCVIEVSSAAFNLGDIYIYNRTHGYLYKKSGGAWNSGTNLGTGYTALAFDPEGNPVLLKVTGAGAVVLVADP